MCNSLILYLYGKALKIYSSPFKLMLVLEFESSFTKNLTSLEQPPGIFEKGIENRYNVLPMVSLV